MSQFAVTVETIASIYPHQNADRLEMATLIGKDYDFVVGKGQFQAGDVVIYFPVDSVLPAWVLGILDLTGKLSGREQNRVRTIKLRGNISQGVVAEPKAFAEARPTILEAVPGDDVTELLEVYKYEPPAVLSKYGDLVALPNFVTNMTLKALRILSIWSKR